MVAINRDVDDSISIKLAKPIDPVGKLEITTSRSRLLRWFNTGTATLVAPNKILTAAHVIDTDLDGKIDITDVSQYSFLLGDDLEKEADYNLKIKAVSLHPSWVASETKRVNKVNGKKNINSRYDLAVLTLSSNVTAVESLAVSPEIAELAKNKSLLGKKATIVGYGKYGSSSASLSNDGLRRAAENIIDSVNHGIIRFDYDSTYASQQDEDEGLNHPNLDGSSPELIPVPNSSPTPISLEGGIGQGDSGGPLLVSTDLNTPVVVGVASQFIDTEVFGGLAFSDYGSVYVYTALNEPENLKFLDAENVIDLDGLVATSAVVASDTQVIETNSEDISPISSELVFPSSNSMAVDQAEMLLIQNDELNLVSTDNYLDLI